VIVLALPYTYILVNENIINDKLKEVTVNHLIFSPFCRISTFARGTQPASKINLHLEICLLY